MRDGIDFWRIKKKNKNKKNSRTEIGDALYQYLPEHTAFKSFYMSQQTQTPNVEGLAIILKSGPAEHRNSLEHPLPRAQ